MESILVLFFVVSFVEIISGPNWGSFAGLYRTKVKNVLALLIEVFAFYPNEPVVRNQLVSFWSQKMLRVHFPGSQRLFFPTTRQGSFDHVNCCPLAPWVRIYSLPSQKLDILSHLHGKQKALAFTKWVLGLFSICFALYPLPSLGGRIQCVHPWPSSPDGVEGALRKASRWVAVMMQYMTIASMYMKEPAQQDVPRRMGFFPRVMATRSNWSCLHLPSWIFGSLAMKF